MNDRIAPSMKSEITLRRLKVEEDLDWIHSLNEANVPEVGSISKERLTALLSKKVFGTAAVLPDGTPGAAILVFDQNTEYDSPNFLWFKERYDEFWYIDRVMVADHARGKGVGRAIYDDLIISSRTRTSAIACEVNSLPPNPGSMAFHKKMGFEPVGELVHEPGRKSVTMFACII